MSGLVSPPDPITQFINDLQAAFTTLTQHEPAGTWAVVVLSFVATLLSWYWYGGAVGAPLLASFFICLSFIMPSAATGASAPQTKPPKTS